MAFDKSSPVISIWDGNELVELRIYCPNATSPQPDRLEEELVRIFHENQIRGQRIKELEKENKDLEILALKKV